MSLFETPTPLTEAELLDRADLQGRKSELKQLLKALTLCKTGQGKAILLTGNEGIGKSALLDAFAQLAQTHLSTPVLRLQARADWTPQRMFTEVLEGLLDQAQGILTVALDEANRILAPLDMRWTEADLVRMVAMTHLQDTGYGRSQADLAAMSESIKRAIPFFKRMSLPVQEQLDQLGRLIIHPWVVLAASLLNPLNPTVQAARDLADPLSMQRSVAMPLLGGDTQASESFEAPEEEPGSTTVTLDKLIRAMVEVLASVNRGLQQQSALVLMLDQWEQVAEVPSAVQADLKTFWVEVLRQTTDQRDFRLMVVLACRSEAESYSLGGAIYNAFRLKYLVPPLAAPPLKKLLKAWALEESVVLSDEAQEAMVTLAHGNPAWLELLWKALVPEFAAGLVAPEKLIQRYPSDSPSMFLELLFTRVQLDFIGEESRLLRMVGRMIQQFGPQPFERSQLTSLIQDLGEVSPDWIGRLLHAMTQNALLQAQPEGRYALSGAFVLGWLQQKIRPVQEDMPSQDKLASLKTVLPLAIQSDELTREKLLEMISMASALNDTEMLDFMETTMAQAVLNEDTPVAARLVLIQGLGVLASNQALDVLLEVLDASDSRLVQAALAQWESLSRLPQGRRLEADLWHKVEPHFNSEESALRQAAWQWVAVTDSLSPQVMQVLREGARSPQASIRLAAYAGLQKRGETGPEWLEVLRGQLKSEQDPSLVKAILKALAVFPTETLVRVLKETLESTPSGAVSAEGLNTLIQADWRSALPWISAQLTPQSPIELRLQVLRKLGQQPGYEAETILVEHLQSPHLRPEERWMAIRSLGWAGITRRALTALQAQQGQFAHNDIVAHSLEVALKQLSERLASLPSESVSTAPRTAPSPVTQRIQPPSWYQPAQAQGDSGVIELIPAAPPESDDWE